MLSAFQDLWWFTRACRKTIVLLLITALLQQAMSLIMPIAIGRIVDVIASNEPVLIQSQSAILLVFIIGSMLGINVVSFFRRHAMVRMVHKARGAIICDAYAHLLRLPIAFHEDRKTGDKTKIVENGTDKAIHLAEDWASRGVPVMCYYVLSVGVLLYYWPAAAMLVAICVPVLVTSSVLFYQLGKPSREKRHDYYEEAESLLIEGFQNISTIQSFRMEEARIQRMQDIWKQIYEAGFKELRSADIGFVLRNATILVVTGIVLWLGLSSVASGTMTGGTLIIGFFLTLRITNDLWHLGGGIDLTITDAPAIRRLREFFMIEPEIQESPVALHLGACEGSIAFEGVSFRYPGTETDAVHSFSLQIPAGKTTALVGPSGAGKSSVFKLIRRLIDPTAGKILIDGHDIRDLKLDFRSHIAVVSQEVEVFSDTIANNIAAANEDLPRHEIERFGVIACIDEFVRELPDGYDTEIGERGIKLSGGQRQRLAIARALAANCKIILFDEATSHLDAKSEQMIKQAIETLIGNCTLVVIAHRLSTIRHADNIIVMERGEIFEQGTHDELKALKEGLYRDHLGIQAS